VATVTGVAEALKAIKGLSEVKDDVKVKMGTAAVHAEDAMRLAISHSLPTGYYADDGKRIDTGNMIDSTTVWWSDDDTVKAGIQSPRGYEVGQDLGWGKWGDAAMPNGAKKDNLKGFFGRDAAMAAAKAVLDVELK
jgi:hypothetical protein